MLRTAPRIELPNEKHKRPDTVYGHVSVIKGLITLIRVRPEVPLCLTSYRTTHAPIIPPLAYLPHEMDPHIKLHCRT